MAWRGSSIGSFELGAIAFVAASIAGACGHDWDALDPRLGSSATSVGGASTNASTNAASGGATAGSGGASTITSSGTQSSASGMTTAGSSGGGGTSSSAVGSTGSTGSGGAMPIHCGGTSALAYDFQDPADPKDLFAINPSNNATPAQSGGEGVITLPSGQASKSFGSFSTIRRYNLLGDRAFAKVSVVPSMATTAAAIVEITSGQDYLAVQELSGMLHFSANLAGAYTDLGSISYDPVKHLYWGLRDDGMGTTYWETSEDGVSFTVQAQMPTAQIPFSLSTVELQLAAQTTGGEVNPGSAHFDDVNGGGPPKGKWCKSSSFTDDFDDGVRAATWGRAFADPGTVVTESGGTLNVALPVNGIGFGGYEPWVAFDATDDAILVQVVTPPNAATSAQAYLRAENSPANGVDIVYEKGTVYFRQQIANAISDVASVLVSASTSWLRIREAAGITYWEASADGKTWKTYAMKADVIDMSRVDVRVGGGTYMNVAMPGSDSFDNYNIAP